MLLGAETNTWAYAPAIVTWLVLLWLLFYGIRTLVTGFTRTVKLVRRWWNRSYQCVLSSSSKDELQRRWEEQYVAAHGRDDVVPGGTCWRVGGTGSQGVIVEVIRNGKRLKCWHHPAPFPFSSDCEHARAARAAMMKADWTS